jgi:hypothetical protein
MSGNTPAICDQRDSRFLQATERESENAIVPIKLKKVQGFGFRV